MYQVVDVRDAIEIADLPLANAPHAQQIPLDELRDRSAELDPSQPTLVLCHSGLRSTSARGSLLSTGSQQVFNLSGAASVRDLALNRRTPGTI